MTLIEVKTDLNRVAKALERIADLLEMVVNPKQEAPDEISTQEDLGTYVTRTSKDDDAWNAYYPRTNYK